MTLISFNFMSHIVILMVFYSW